MTEKQYYLKHKVVRFFDDDNLYLNYDLHNNNYSLGGYIGDERFQTTFTEKEIQTLKDKYISVLTEFEKMEVNIDELGFFNKKIIDIAKECGIVEEEYAQTQLELIVQKAIELQRCMDSVCWSGKCNLLSDGKVISDAEVSINCRKLKYALGAVFIPLIILSAQLNLDPAECFKLAIDDLEKCDIEG